jgi:hypothetical protein
MHLILGHTQDACCADVLSRLRKRGLRARLVTAPLEPPGRLIWHLDSNGLTTRLTLDDGPAEEIESVFVRSTGWLDPNGWEPADHAYMQSETHAALLACLAGLPCPVINRASAALWYRPRNSFAGWLPLLSRCGLPAPEMVLTDDPEEARAFGRRLEAAGVPGVVCTSLTQHTAWLVGPADWDGLAAVQTRTPVCLSEPHGPALAACVVGRRVIWNGRPGSSAAALEPPLLRLAAEAGLDFLEVAVAPVRRGTAVVLVEPLPQLELFGPSARAGIVDSLIGLLTGKPNVVRVPREAHA